MARHTKQPDRADGSYCDRQYWAREAGPAGYSAADSDPAGPGPGQAAGAGLLG